MDRIECGPVFSLKSRVKRKKLNPKTSYMDRARTLIPDLISSRRQREGYIPEIGCTSVELMWHIERQFTDGMTWKNYGWWEVDHIVPCKSFDHNDVDSVHRCNHWSNLQPMWAELNMLKSNTDPGPAAKAVYHRMKNLRPQQTRFCGQGKLRIIKL